MITYVLNLHDFLHIVYEVGLGTEQTREEFAEWREKSRTRRAGCSSWPAGGIWLEAELLFGKPTPRLPELLGIPHLIPGHRHSRNKQWFPHLAVPGSHLVWYLAQREHRVGEGQGTHSSPAFHF